MSIEQFAVLGAGVMGAGIAYQASVAGVATRLKDIDLAKLESGKRSINNLLERQLKSGRIDQAQLERAASCLTLQMDEEGFGLLDMVVEAVVENEVIKTEVLSHVERTLNKSAILTTNSSTISIDRLAASLKRPENFCGLHFFNPVPQMKLVEIVRGSATSAQTVDRCVAFARALNKTPIVVKDCPGFLVNRILFPYFHGFDQLVKEGVEPERIDAVMERFGWPMGPASLADLIGMDVMVAADRVLEQGYPDRMQYQSASIFEQLLEAGALGQKSGVGFYQYQRGEAGERIKTLNPALRKLIEPSQSVVDDEAIHWRLMLPLITEALRALDERVVASGDDLQIAAELGLGFPATRGGLWGYISGLGQQRISELVSEYAELGELYSYHGRWGETLGNSRVVSSSQVGVHRRLAEVVGRHLQHPFQKPYSAHTLAAFEETRSWMEQQGKPLIFDSCCGVGESSRIIAERHPKHAVIAIDRSEVRLEKHQRCFDNPPDNLWFVRADLNDFWRLAAQHGWQLDYHFLLYPNPYPKPGQLQRRWHASPVFSALLQLGGELIVRSNWKTYIDEFVAALSVVSVPAQSLEYRAAEPISAFERKYWESGQQSWECRADLNLAKSLPKKG